jgi:hypothetical protein
MIMAKKKTRAKAKRPPTRRKRRSSPAETNGHVSDGTMEIIIQGKQPRRIVADVMVVKLACEELEIAHKLKPDAKGQLHATPKFAIALSESFRELGYETTPNVAIAMWQRANEHFGQLQKKTN